MLVGLPGRTALVLALLLSACARDLVSEPGGFHSASRGYRIGVPQGESWRRVDLEGAALAFRRGDDEMVSLQARCDRPVTTPALMARHLVIGIPERVLRETGPAVVAGRPAWTQTFDARVDASALRVKTVTLVADGCAYDFVLVAGPSYDAAEQSFDAWVGGFSLDDVDTAGTAP
jgi:hypothetical protein